MPVPEGADASVPVPEGADAEETESSLTDEECPNPEEVAAAVEYLASLPDPEKRSALFARIYHELLLAGATDLRWEKLPDWTSLDEYEREALQDVMREFLVAIENHR